MKHKLSVIIVTYNSIHLIEECLSSIFRYNDLGIGLQVIVIDNNSSQQNETFEYISHHYPDVECYDSGKNGGYGYGNNIGFKYVDSPYFIVMNPDIRIISPIFKRVFNALEADKSIGMAGVCFIDGSKPYYLKPEAVNIRSIFKEYILKIPTQYNMDRHYPSGSFLVFSCAAFKKAGCFDENIFMYFEEADVSNRIISIGNTVCLLKDIKVLHLAHGREVKRSLIEVERKSLEYYCEKYSLNIDPIVSNWKLFFNFVKLVSTCLNDKLRIERTNAYLTIFCK